MKQQLQPILHKLAPILTIMRRYLLVIVVVVYALLYVFLVVRINQLSTREPTDEQVAGKLEAIQRPKVDQDTLNKIQQLEDGNIQVKTLFDQARQNPFSE